MHLDTLFTQDLTAYTLITFNQRSALRLQTLYNQQQQTTVWPSLDVLALDNWLVRTWEESLHTSTVKNPPYLINSGQSQQIWHDIIAETPELSLLDIYATTQLVQRAWYLVQHWQISLTQLANTYHPDQQMFLNWVKQYQQILQQKNYVDSNTLLPYLIQAYATTALSIPKKILLFGFHDASPLLQNFLTALPTSVQHIATNNRHQEMYYITCENTEQEMQAMARWAKQRAQQGQKIACVVPQLQQQRRSIQRVFQQVFQEPGKLNLNTEQTTNFSISGGEMLAKYPLIQQALFALSFNHRAFNLTEIQDLLSSIFFTDAATPLSQRERFINDLYEHVQATLNLQDLIVLLKKSNLHMLAQRFENYQQITIESHSLATLTEWANLFSLQLQALAWPGHRQLNSEEYQLSLAWEKLLQAFIQLDIVTQQTSLTAALRILNHLANTSLFQAKSAATHVEILGLLETIDLEFDAIWIMGLNDQTWPSLAKPNPFIPYNLQTQLKLPQANQQIEYQYCQKLMQCFKQQTPLLITSYAQQNADLKVHASPLLDEFTPLSINALQLSNFQDFYTLSQQQVFEYCEDTQGPPLSTLQTLKGGISIFRLQSHCPFQAFAKLRLNAFSVPTSNLGLNALQRGVLVHRILELFWQDCQDHLKLSKYTEQALHKTITTFVKKALNEYSHEFIALKQKNFYAIEQTRLIQLITHWLESEKQRPAFKVIATEEQQTLTIGKIECRVKIDRIDQVNENEYYIIDYKTGKTSTKKWFGERLEEPQLPIYLLHSLRPISGILFASLHPESMQYLGVTKFDSGISGVKCIEQINDPACLNNWQQQLQAWQSTIHQLADDFIAGHAEVDPLNSNTCTQCDLMSFCRLLDEE